MIGYRTRGHDERTRRPVRVRRSSGFGDACDTPFDIATPDVATSTLLGVAEQPWDQLRYQELMQSYRLLSTQVTQYNLGVTLALVTLLGFAIDRESWGIAALGVALEVLMFFIIEVHRRASIVLLAEAAALEGQTGSASTTEAMQALMSGRRGNTRAAGQVALVVAMVCHIALVLYFAIGQNWSFAGGESTG
jgi:hypothetical protein